MPAMELPQNVKRAVRILYTSLGIGVFRTIVYASEMGEMAGELLVHCLLAVVIYRISKGRNWARILYFVLAAFGWLLAAGAAWHGFDLPPGLLPTTTVEMVLVCIEAALDAVAVILLLGKSASLWFQGQ